MVLIYLAKPKRKEIREVFKSKILYLTLLAAYGAILLRNIAIASNVSYFLASLLPRQLTSVSIILIPLILSALTGLASTGISLAVPLLQGLVNITVRGASLIYMTSFLGYLISPAHLCLIVTTQYFKSHIAIGYRYLIPASALTLIFTLILYYFWP